jgi:anti-anti-sigma factor
MQISHHLADSTALALVPPAVGDVEPLTVADFEATAGPSSGDVVVVVLHGELDIATIPRLRAALEPLVDARQRAVLDLSDLTFIGAGGIAEFIRARRLLRARGADLRLRAPSTTCRRVLEIIGAEHMLEARS